MMSQAIEPCWCPPRSFGRLAGLLLTLLAKVNESAHLIIRSLANPDTTTASERYAIPWPEEVRGLAVAHKSKHLDVPGNEI